MISINIGALRISQAKLQAARKTIIKRADAGYRQKLFYLIEAAARVSPQFSGDFASNWFLAVDGNMPVYRPLPAKYGVGAGMRETESGHYAYSETPHKAGDPEAVQIALQRAAGVLAHVTLKNRVHLVNATELHTDGTRMIGPDGVEQLRGDNVIPGRVRIESYLRAVAKQPIKLRPE